jgi:DNA integrity scanning protein DisA with diadenylate cyclase activity
LKILSESFKFLKKSLKLKKSVFQVIQAFVKNFSDFRLIWEKVEGHVLDNLRSTSDILRDSASKVLLEYAIRWKIIDLFIYFQTEKFYRAIW